MRFLNYIPEIDLGFLVTLNGRRIKVALGLLDFFRTIEIICPELLRLWKFGVHKQQLKHLCHH